MHVFLTGPVQIGKSTLIAAALDAGFLAHELAMSGRRCQGGEGIAGTDAENSIDKVGELAARGMSGTDRVILELMLS